MLKFPEFIFHEFLSENTQMLRFFIFVDCILLNDMNFIQDLALFNYGAHFMIAKTVRISME